MGKLEGKTAIITGAASGFGEGMAELFVNEGARVAILDINLDKAIEVARRLGSNAVAHACDVTSSADIKRCADQVLDNWGAIDIVVNNAGWSHSNKPMEEVGENEFDMIYAVNVKAIYYMCQATLTAMRKNGGGTVLNIGSTAGIRPRPGLTWYNSSKGAVNLLSRSMAVELAPDNIRVNCIAPVLGVTGMMETFMGVPDTPENRQKFVETIPLGRPSMPRDIANAALYLVSDDADFVTGVVLEIDGGRCI